MRSNKFLVLEMQRKKPKVKERIKLKMRVQLKSELSSDGEVVGKGEAKARWKVKWNDGSLKGKVTEQHSKSLRAWQLDLSGFIEDGSSSDGEDAPELSEVDYETLKRQFAAHAPTLVGQKVAVSKHSNLSIAFRQRNNRPSGKR